MSQNKAPEQQVAPNWAKAVRSARRRVAQHRKGDPPLSAKVRRLWQAGQALDAPRARLRATLLATLPKGRSRKGLRFKGKIAPEQGILNAGALLHWRLEDGAGRVQAAAYEKLFRRLKRKPRSPSRKDWLAEPRALAGLQPLTDTPGCTLPPLLALHRHKGALGVVTADLTLQGWVPVSLEQAVQNAPRIATALAALACDYAVRPPFACRHLTIPVCRPFFARLSSLRIERVEQALRDCGIDHAQAERTHSGLAALDRAWDRRVAGCGLPWRAAHGDPYFRNILMREGAVALVDLEAAVIGPVGLDIGRFIGTTLMRGIEARALAAHEGRAPPDALAAWHDRRELQRLADACLDAYITALHQKGLQLDRDALTGLARISALMGFCYGSSILLRASSHSPVVTAPVAQLIVNWVEVIER